MSGGAGPTPAEEFTEFLHRTLRLTPPDRPAAGGDRPVTPATDTDRPVGTARPRPPAPNPAQGSSGTQPPFYPHPREVFAERLREVLDQQLRLGMWREIWPHPL